MRSQRWKDHQKAFVHELEQMSHSYSLQDKFRDFCRISAIEIHNPLFKRYGHDQKLYEDYEREYKTIKEKYGESGFTHMVAALKEVVCALDDDHEDFLGNSLEGIGAANTWAGQFLTPNDVARLLADIVVGRPSVVSDGQEQKSKLVENYKRLREQGKYKVITLNDCAAGAGALMIEGAESLIREGVRQGDILVFAEDLDFTAFNICYVQLSLLGLAGIVTRQNSLTMQVFEGPWYTPGFFLHHMPMRGVLERIKREAEDAERMVAEVQVEEKPVEKSESPAAKEEKPANGPKKTIQMELF